MRGDSFAATGEAEPVGRRRAYVDEARVDPERTREPTPHLLAVRCDPRVLPDDDAVGVDDLVAGFEDLPVRLGKQIERVCAVEALVVRREERADVSPPGRAENRIG